MPDDPAVDALIDEHRAAGAFLDVDGLRTFVREEGSGDPVVLMHGLPTSSYLYRKVIPEVAQRGFRALSFDLPGLGMTDRPKDFDYTLAGLGRFSYAAVDALGLDRFHLVVHDAGGPVGFDLAVRCGDRIASLTILNTVLGVGRTPFPGELYARFASQLRGPMRSPVAWRQLMYAVGIANRSATTDAEVDVYRALLLEPDGGAGYLRIMGLLGQQRGKVDYSHVVDTRSVPYPVALAWGGLDPILSLRRMGWRALAATHLPSMTVLPGKHYLQEDNAPEIAAIIARNAIAGSDGIGVVHP